MVLFTIPQQLWVVVFRLASTAVPVLITVLTNFFQLSDLLKSSVSLFKDSGKVYDFIVVGGGSSGCVIANRLTENPDISVLLIESGGDQNPITLLPLVTADIQRTQIDWSYATEPKEGIALASRDQRVIWPRGKMLGGSSGINYMMYNRGHPKDFDLWKETTGDARWGYDNLLKYFLKIEDYYGYWDDGVGNWGNHSKNGPLRVERSGSFFLVERLLRAGEEMGLPARDMNSGQGPGFSPIDFWMKRGFRFSNNRGYLKSVKNRPNLKIHRFSHATKIDFEEVNGIVKAVGVFYLRHGVKFYAAANKEVIVTCGSVGSPQLLMLSGIGPKDHLLEVGINPIVDLPVGNNLHDHVMTYVGPFLFNKMGSSFIYERDLTLGSIWEYLKSGTGPASVPEITTNGYFSTKGDNWPNICWIFSQAGLSKIIPPLVNNGFSTDIFDRILGPYLGQDGIGYVAQYLGRPKSRGYLKLRDKDPLSRPLIYPNYYGDEDDFEVMIDGIEAIVNIVENSSSLGIELEARLAPVPLPGCEKLMMRSRPYWKCWLRTLTSTIYHPVGTCKLGRREDPSTVVDSELRVKGVHGLRVTDSSIMPIVPNANLNAPTTVIAEMAAEMILESWHLLS